MVSAGVILGLAALLLAAGSAALWFQRASAVQLPRNRGPFVTTWVAGAALGALALSQTPGWLGGVPAVAAIVIGAFLTFTVTISRQKVAPGGIAVGAKLPAVRAPDENGETFDLASLAGSPVLMKFFRGHW